MISDKILYDYAMSFVGLPYRWGGDDPMDGFDCSGLVIEILKSAGLLPAVYDNTAQGLYREFMDEALELSEAEFGALCFFGENLKRITHVGFALDYFRMLEAGGGNSLTKSDRIASDQNAFVRIRPIANRKDLLLVLHPNP